MRTANSLVHQVLPRAREYTLEIRRNGVVALTRTIVPVGGTKAIYARAYHHEIVIR